MNELLRRLLFLPPQASTVAERIDALHFTVISATMLAAVLIASAALWFAVRDRASLGRRRVTPEQRRSTRRIEGALTAVTLAAFLAFWVVGFREYAEMAAPPKDALVVYVTAKQWMWQFAHEEGPSEAGVLTVPAHRPIRLVMTSRDVIHSFYVPAFRTKTDVIPGRYVTTWFEAKQEGTYDLMCAEYCGTSHSAMLAKVVVLSPDAYARWLEGAGGITSLAARGREIAAKEQCFGCHTIDGRTHVGPTFRGLYGARVTLTDGRVVVADEAYLTRSMMQPNEEIVVGYKPVMPAYLARLEAGDAAALLAYLRALGDEDTAAAIGAPPRASGPLEVDAGAR